MVSAPAMAKRAETPERWSTDLEQVVRHLGDQLRLLADDGDLVVELGRVVRADLGAEAVLERRDDAAAVGVVLRVGGGDDQHVEVEAHHVAPDLDVALLHHVEHRDLDALGEVGQLVDGDDAAVAARDEPVVDRLGVAQEASLGDLHRVDVTDQVGDRGVGGGELLGVPLAAVHPGDRQRVAVGLDEADGGGGDRRQRVLAELGARDDRGPLVEQSDERAQQAGLALAALAEQHDVVPGDEGALELRQHRVVEAVQAGPRVLPRRQQREQVGADLRLHRARPVVGRPELPEGGDGGRCGSRSGHVHTLDPEASTRDGATVRRDTGTVRGVGAAGPRVSGIAHAATAASTMPPAMRAKPIT
jgi:hypothetical protein